MDTAELLKKVRKVEIKTRGLSSDLLAGEYHSAFKGRGMSFSEVREYQYGDDIRAIDWNVTARFSHPYIKVFEEERELTVMLMLDMSRSAFFGSTTQLKNELIAEVSAVLSFAAINNNDKVGAIFFTDQIEKFIPPKKGKPHILRIIREIIGINPKGKGTDIGGVLRFFSNVTKKRSIAFLLSDFMGHGYETPLQIAARKHDLIGLHIFDPRESELPDMGIVRFFDEESGSSKWIDTSSKKLRRAYAKNYAVNLDYFIKNFRRAGADTISINTAQPYINELHKFFRRRESR